MAHGGGVAHPERGALLGLERYLRGHLQHRVVGPSLKLYGHLLVGLVRHALLQPVGAALGERREEVDLEAHVQPFAEGVGIVLAHGVAVGDDVALDPYAGETLVAVEV